MFKSTKSKVSKNMIESFWNKAAKFVITCLWGKEMKKEQGGKD